MSGAVVRGVGNGPAAAGDAPVTAPVAGAEGGRARGLSEAAGADGATVAAGGGCPAAWTPPGAGSGTVCTPVASAGISSTQPGWIRFSRVSTPPSGWVRPLLSSKISW